MMKVLLLNSPPLKRTGIVGQIYPPLGILYLASYLRDKIPDVELKVIDGYHEASIDEVEKKILEFSPDVLGISSTTQAATGMYDIINRLKGKQSKMFIVVGGPHATVFPNECFTRSKPDVVVMGEGEVTFHELIQKLMSNDDYRGIKGIAFKHNGDIVANDKRPLIPDLDTIPFPARDLVDIKIYPGYHYKKRAWDTSYLSGRGCPYDCVYCSNPIWKQQKPWIRVRSPKNIADEIESMMSQYGVSEFYDQTDLFNGNIGWSKKVCNELISRNLDINWKVQMTVKNIDEELAQKMVKAGCWLGILGVETGNDTTSLGINKRSSRALAEKSLSILKASGMKTFALLMAFNVWEEEGKLKYENREDSLKTLKFAKDMIKKNYVDVISWSLTTPYPGSELFAIAKRHNLISPDIEGRWELWDSSENFLMNLPGVSKKDWNYIQRKGKLLQIYLLFKSGTFNFRSLPIYFRKAVSLLKEKII